MERPSPRNAHLAAHAARVVLQTHDALRSAIEAEPTRDVEGAPSDPDLWLAWHVNAYRPAYARWNDALSVLAQRLGEPVGRHPFTFRPLCEHILALPGVAATREP